MNILDYVSQNTRIAVEELANQAPQDPLVSIVVPTYQHHKFIEKCVYSILEQCLETGVEILLGDDGSTDGTREICISLGRQHPDKIRVFLHHPQNRVVIDGVQTGHFNLVYLMSRARGRYICICEGDDYWRDARKLHAQARILNDNPEASVVFGKSVIVRDDRETDEFKPSSGQCRNLSAIELAIGSPVPTQTAMMRNIFDKEFPTDFFRVLNGDTYLFSFLSKHGNAIYLDSVSPCGYRMHQGGMWSQLPPMAKMRLSIDTTRAMLRLHDDVSIRRRLNLRIFRQTRNLARLQFEERKTVPFLLSLMTLLRVFISHPGACAPELMHSFRARFPNI